MATWTRTYTDPSEQKPYLSYAAFGGAQLVKLAQEWALGTLRDHLEVVSSPTAPFRSGAVWELLRKDRPELAAQVEQAETAVLVSGPVADHENLDYLRETIELLSYLIGHDAVAVYDTSTHLWWSPEEWEEVAIDGLILNPFDHVAVNAVPASDGTTRLETRGLRKFGRPDLVMRDVLPPDVESARKLIDRFVNHQALGAMIEPGRTVRMEGLDGVYLPGPVVGSLEDPGLDNVHIVISRVDP